MILSYVFTLDKKSKPKVFYGKSIIYELFQRIDTYTQVLIHVTIGNLLVAFIGFYT